MLFIRERSVCETKNMGLCCPKFGPINPETEAVTMVGWILYQPCLSCPIINTIPEQSGDKNQEIAFYY